MSASFWRSFDNLSIWNLVIGQESLRNGRERLFGPGQVALEITGKAETWRHRARLLSSSNFRPSAGLATLRNPGTSRWHDMSSESDPGNERTAIFARPNLSAIRTRWCIHYSSCSSTGEESSLEDDLAPDA
jgi:hypothetical protein